jgi:biopolymer transport protein ExbD
MFKFGKKKKKKAQNGEMELQITSMADIFTILLVFLLKSYSTSAAQISPSGMTLPQAVAGQANEDAVKVQISQTGIQVEGEPIMELKDGKFVTAPASGMVDALGVRLEKERKRQELIAASNPDVKLHSRVIIVADEKVPYSTLKAVLLTSATQGFTDSKLAVIQKE